MSFLLCEWMHEEMRQIDVCWEEKCSFSEISTWDSAQILILLLKLCIASTSQINEYFSHLNSLIIFQNKDMNFMHIANTKWNQIT